MERKHAMPFGAEVLANGNVRFRLWAPAAKGVTLCLENGRGAYPLLPLENGWFERISSEATAGSLYRFQIDDKMEVPDPASRFQPQDVHGPSEVVDPTAFQWRDDSWRGRPWEKLSSTNCTLERLQPREHFAESSRSSTISVI